MSVFVCVCECAYQEEIKLEITRIIYKQYCEAPKNKFKTLKIEILLQERVLEWINKPASWGWSCKWCSFVSLDLWSIEIKLDQDR